MELTAHRITGWLHAPRPWTVGLLGMALGPPLGCLAMIVFVRETNLFSLGPMALWIPVAIGAAACMLLPTRHVLTRIAVAVPYALLVKSTIMYFGLIAVCVLYSDCL